MDKNKTTTPFVTIFEVKINPTSYNKTINHILSWLKQEKPRYLVTPNPEIITYAQKDHNFKDILNKADLSIPDGAGLLLASNKLTQKVTGTDLLSKLLPVAQNKNLKIGFLGSDNKTLQALSCVLVNKYPKLKVFYLESGGEISISGKPKNPLPTPSQKIDILFIALGFPKQEYWISKNLNTFPAKVFIPVGGALDYLSGKVKRAPLLLKKLHLEWFYRLINQPQRAARQLKGLNFFLLILKEKLT